MKNQRIPCSFKETFMSICKQAENPAEKYRPVPFWSWNDKLEADELARQINLMHEAGIGGYFMHARGGLQTKYLSEDWFNATKAAVDAGAKLNMCPWAYDENGWPSGFGDGKVNALGLKYQQKYLRSKTVKVSELADTEHVIACYTAEGKRLAGNETASQDEVLLLYFDVNPYYVDTLDWEATEKFIGFVHQAYYDSLSEEQRKAMKGFFTDEPQISRNGIPWSFKHEEEYRKAWGEDLLDVLPQLLHPMEGCERTRYRFWRTTTRMFLNHFMKPIYDWCEAHSWRLTGHMVLEDNYLCQLTSNGAVMPMYQYFHIPGIDALGRGHTTLATPMQLFSAAAQTGRKQTLIETFAMCGWAVDFADLRWLYQFYMVHGVNLLCQHLEGYSLRGIRKRDYPASLFIHQPWWKDYKPFNDMCSRVGLLLAEGEIKVNTLLIHGMATAHMLFDGTRESADIIGKYSSHFEQLSYQLAGAHVDHHYGDETLMEQYGSVKDGRLVIGRQSYNLVILPKLLNLSSFQVKLLEEYIAQGGKVLAVKNDISSAFYVDGERCDNAEFLKKISFFTEEELVQKVMDEADPVLSVIHGTDYADVTCFAAQAKQIHVTRRDFTDFDGKSAQLYYYVNTERFEACDTDLYLNAPGVEVYDPETGKILPTAYETTGTGVRVPHRFEPAGSLILIARDYSAERIVPAVKPEQLLTCHEGPCRLVSATENLLTLDYCGYEADGKLVSEREYVLTIHDKLLTLERDVETTLIFTFETGKTYPLGQDLTLLLERPERYTIEVNGTVVSNKSEGYFADKAFERIAIGSAVVAGRNTIRLTTLFHQTPETFRNIAAAKIFEAEKNKLSYDSEIEAVYLCGNFGVKSPAPFEPLEDYNVSRNAGPFILEALPETVDLTHLEQSGFPFFAGELTFAQTMELSVEEALCSSSSFVLKRIYANVADIRINGTYIGKLTRPDYILNIPGGILKAGTNEVEITLVNSLRNMLGPFHLAAGDTYWCAPGSFYEGTGIFSWCHDPNWNQGYSFYRFGIEPEIIH